MKFSIIITIMVFFFLPANCQSQNNIDLYLYKKDGKVGLINGKGEIILKANYSHIGKFEEGKAAITITSRAKNNYHKILDTKLGYINTAGEVVIPLKFQHIHDEIKDFSEGLAVIKINNKYGYINAEGKIVIQPKYSRAYPFKEGYAVVEFNGDYSDRALIDKNGKVVFRFLEKYQAQVDSLAKSILLSNSIPQLSEDKIAVHRYNNNGKRIASVFNSKGEILFTKELFGITSYEDGVAIATMNDCRIGSENCLFLIDDEGNRLTLESFYSIVRIKHDYFLVENALNGHQKIIDKKGNILRPPIEEDVKINVSSLKNSSNLISVHKNGMTGYINESGELVIDFLYMSATPFSEGMAFVKKLDYTVLCIDKTGNIVFDIDAKYYADWSFPFGYVSLPYGIYQNGIATLIMTIDGKSEIVHIDKTGKFLTIKEK